MLTALVFNFFHANLINSVSIVIFKEDYTFPEGKESYADWWIHGLHPECCKTCNSLVMLFWGDLHPDNQQPIGAVVFYYHCVHSRSLRRGIFLRSLTKLDIQVSLNRSLQRTYGGTVVGQFLVHSAYKIMYCTELVVRILRCERFKITTLFIFWLV